ncbi:GNAT family N-acetyltransferase [Streptomyces sp. NPDC051636]|uniref:GNAT family N-acetyltransferase n=1 Tax=Streptomyces sp. NPDC051636 TaxID=3365663 RepID=UPI0037A61320
MAGRDRRRPGHRPPGDGAALGLIGWNDIDLAGGSAEIVYRVLPPARGGGVVVRAVRRITRWALDDLGLHRLRLCHAVADAASCRVAEKTGYLLEGTMRGALLHADGWHDQHLRALVRETPDRRRHRPAFLAGLALVPLCGLLTPAVVATAFLALTLLAGSLIPDRG